MKGRSRVLAGAAVAAVAAASAVVLMDSSDSPSSRSGSSRTSGAGARLARAPTAITNACAQAATSVAFPVLCPARWPPPRGRGARTARIFEKATDVYLIDAANGFSHRGGHVFHLLVGGQRRPFRHWPTGVDPRLRITTRKVTIPIQGGGQFVQQLPARRIASARVHGVRADVLHEPPYPAGGLHGGHLVVLWNEDGHGYLASVHGERLSRRALISIALTMARSTRPSQSAKLTVPLARAPYMAVSCDGRPNWIGCDRVGLYVYLNRPVARLEASIEGRELPMRSGPGGADSRNNWEGFLRPAGLIDGPLKVRPDRGRLYWFGKTPVFARVRLTIFSADGESATRVMKLPLAAGYG
jgi:hypothetical protein